MTQATVQCTSCKNTYPLGKFNNCPSCSHPLNGTQQAHRNKNQEIQGSHNSPIQIQDSPYAKVVIDHAPEANIEYEIHRTNISPVTLMKKPLKAWWAFLLGAIQIIGSLASTINSLLTLSFDNLLFSSNVHIYLPIVFLTSGFLFLSLGIFTSSKHPQYFLGRLFEKSKSGTLFHSTITGKCKKCGGQIKLKNINEGTSEDKKFIKHLVCSNEPQLHRWLFDSTKLPAIENEYSNQT